MMGYDTVFINGVDDDELVRIAWREGRIILTKDTGILQRRIVSTGEVSAILVEVDGVREQIRQVVDLLGLGGDAAPFSLCMECNERLVPRRKEEVRELVPPYVLKTQKRFVQCPKCERVYWRGTHWERMAREVEVLTNGQAAPEGDGDNRPS